MSRRSELQRKLESLPAPEPPASLGDRIKNEIPKDLRFDAERERERLSSSIALNLRVAASILILISTVYLAMHLFTREAATSRPFTATARRDAAVPATTVAEAPAPKPVAVDEPAAPAPHVERQAKTMAKVKKKEEKENAEGVIAAAPAASEALAAPPPSRPTAPAAAKNAVQSGVADTLSVVAQAPVVTPAAGHDLDRGERSPETIVQRFAAPAAIPSGVVLDVEAVEEPVAPRRIVVRASFDCGAAVHDLFVDVIVSDDATGKRDLASSSRWARSEFAGGSRTALVEFALPAGADQPLATIRARYRVGDDPIVQSVEKVVRRADVRAWSVASQRMKRATLAGLWQHGGNAGEIREIARAAGLEDLAEAIAKQF